MIFFDEAGNTGDNLLDPDQPAFTLLSHDFSKEETSEILQPLLVRVKSDELHFAKLRKRKSNLKVFEEVFNSDMIESDRIFYYTSDKFFISSIHLIDRLLEFITNKAGEDLYKNGTNISSANMLHILGTSVCDPEEYRKACIDFSNWTKEKTKISANVFFRQLRKAANTCREDMRELFDLLLFTENHIDEITEGFSDKYTLDPTLSMFRTSCDFWAKKYEKLHLVYIDNSKPLAFFEDMLNFHKIIDDKTVGYGKNKYNSKLKVGDIIPVDSKDYVQIQLADIFVSGINHHVKSLITGQKDELSHIISESKLFNLNSRNAMWPTTNVTPESLGMQNASEGINPLDYYLEQSKKHNFRRK